MVRAGQWSWLGVIPSGACKLLTRTPRTMVRASTPEGACTAEQGRERSKMSNEFMEPMCMGCFTEPRGEVVVTDVCPKCGDVVRLCADHAKALESVRALRCRGHRRKEEAERVAAEEAKRPPPEEVVRPGVRRTVDQMDVEVDVRSEGVMLRVGNRAVTMNGEEQRWLVEEVLLAGLFPPGSPGSASWSNLVREKIRGLWEILDSVKGGG